MASAVSYLDTAIGQDYDYLFKVLLIGDSGVGKSSVVERFCDPQGPFDPNFVSTIGVDFRIKSFKYDGKTVKLQLWDTAGQERFRSITTSYYRGANGILMAYDLTDPRSLQNVDGVWLKEVEKYGRGDASLLLIGNKNDLVESFPTEVATSRRLVQDLMGKHPEGRIVDRVETSAKTGSGVEKAFLALVDDMMAKQHAKALKSTAENKKAYRLRPSTPIEGGESKWCC